MNYITKIAILSLSFVGLALNPAYVALDTLLPGKLDENAAFQALLECVQKYNKLVLCFDVKKSAHKNAMMKVLSQYPDIMFIFVDITKYPFFKKKLLRFHKNSFLLEETNQLSYVQLQAMLNKYYR